MFVQVINLQCLNEIQKKMNLNNKKHLYNFYLVDIRSI